MQLLHTFSFGNKIVKNYCCLVPVFLHSSFNAGYRTGMKVDELKKLVKKIETNDSQNKYIK